MKRIVLCFTAALLAYPAVANDQSDLKSAPSQDYDVVGQWAIFQDHEDIACGAVAWLSDRKGDDRAVQIDLHDIDGDRPVYVGISNGGRAEKHKYYKDVSVRFDGGAPVEMEARTNHQGEILFMRPEWTDETMAAFKEEIIRSDVLFVSAPDYYTGRVNLTDSAAMWRKLEACLDDILDPVGDKAKTNRPQ